MTRKVLLLQEVKLGAGDFPPGAIVTFEDGDADDLVGRGVAAELTVGGTGTMTSGTASSSQAHGLGRVPASVRVTGQHSEVAQPWVSAATSTAFTVNVSSTTTADRAFYWTVD